MLRKVYKDYIRLDNINHIGEIEWNEMYQYYKYYIYLAGSSTYVKSKNKQRLERHQKLLIRKVNGEVLFGV